MKNPANWTFQKSLKSPSGRFTVELHWNQPERTLAHAWWASVIVIFVVFLAVDPLPQELPFWPVTELTGNPEKIAPIRLRVGKLCRRSRWWSYLEAVHLRSVARNTTSLCGWNASFLRTEDVGWERSSVFPSPVVSWEVRSSCSQKVEPKSRGRERPNRQPPFTITTN